MNRSSFIFIFYFDCRSLSPKMAINMPMGKIHFVMFLRSIFPVHIQISKFQVLKIEAQSSNCISLFVFFSISFNVIRIVRPMNGVSNINCPIFREFLWYFLQIVLKFRLSQSAHTMKFYSHLAIQKYRLQNLQAQ